MELGMRYRWERGTRKTQGRIRTWRKAARSGQWCTRPPLEKLHSERHSERERERNGSKNESFGLNYKNKENMHSAFHCYFGFYTFICIVLSNFFIYFLMCLNMDGFSRFVGFIGNYGKLYKMINL